jgi:hypothetical protein
VASSDLNAATGSRVTVRYKEDNGHKMAESVTLAAPKARRRSRWLQPSPKRRQRARRSSRLATSATAPQRLSRSSSSGALHQVPRIFFAFESTIRTTRT